MNSKTLGQEVQEPQGNYGRRQESGPWGENCCYQRYIGFLGPAEEEATVVAGKWEEVEGVARGEAAVGAHLHNFLESATCLIFSLPSQQHELVISSNSSNQRNGRRKKFHISWQASP